MERQKRKVDSEALLRAARENYYSSPVNDDEPSKPVDSDKPRKERGKRPSHRELFVKSTSLKARTGMQSYIRPEFHEQIQRILDVLGNKEVSIASYLDNVLAYHFEMFASEIKQELDDEFKSKYNSNIKFNF